LAAFLAILKEGRARGYYKQEWWHGSYFRKKNKSRNLGFKPE
jgi:hypothetical protein